MTPERRALLYIEDIIEHAQLALQFTRGRQESDLESDVQLQFAVVRALEVVGEAARSVPQSVRDMAPSVPWQQIVIMRNKIVHHYFGVKLHVVWSVVENDLPPSSPRWSLC
ncbi:MAG: DUF86 domain-containing protein [Fimbriimonas sp.]